MLARSGNAENGFVQSLNDADKASVPFDDNVPIVYPDKKTWEGLVTERKMKYSTMDVPKKPNGETAGGTKLESPYYAQDDVEYKWDINGRSPGSGTDYGGAPGSHSALGGKFNQSLVGNRSLKIDVVQTPSGADQVLCFYSLGVEPRLAVTLANRTRLSALGWGLALLVGLIGVAVTRRPLRRKTAYVLAVATLATIVPLAIDSIEIAQLCNMVFYASGVVAIYYLAIGAGCTLLALGRRLCGWCAAKCVCRKAAAKSSAAVLLMAGSFVAMV